MCPTGRLDVEARKNLFVQNICVVNLINASVIVGLVALKPVTSNTAQILTHLKNECLLLSVLFYVMLHPEDYDFVCLFS